MESEIKRAIEERVRPMLAFHQGSIDFVSFENGVVRVRLGGACRGCPLSQLTLKSGVETLLKEQFLGVERVEAVNESVSLPPLTKDNFLL
jgi:Fe-S cluster biogenesis protein NfuA